MPSPASSTTPAIAASRTPPERGILRLLTAAEIGAAILRDLLMFFIKFII